MPLARTGPAKSFLTLLVVSRFPLKILPFSSMSQLMPLVVYVMQNSSTRCSWDLDFPWVITPIQFSRLPEVILIHCWMLFQQAHHAPSTSSSGIQDRGSLKTQEQLTGKPADNAYTSTGAAATTSPRTIYTHSSMHSRLNRPFINQFEYNSHHGLTHFIILKSLDYSLIQIWIITSSSRQLSMMRASKRIETKFFHFVGWILMARAYIPLEKNCLTWVFLFELPLNSLALSTQVQLVPSNVQDTRYSVTHWSKLGLPCVITATQTSFLVELTCTHWLVLLTQADQAEKGWLRVNIQQSGFVKRLEQVTEQPACTVQMTGSEKDEGRFIVALLERTRRDMAASQKERVGLDILII